MKMKRDYNGDDSGHSLYGKAYCMHSVLPNALRIVFD